MRGSRLIEQPDIPEFLGQIHIFSVSELTGKIKQRLTSAPEFQHLALQGEVSNFTKSHAGHIYFSMKDSGAQIKCVSFRSRVERLAYIPKEGDEVIAFGSINVYPQGGAYQLYVDELFHAGRGELFAKYLELKEQLENEGLFDSERKKAIPQFPKCVGIVTSPRGAAVRDILKIIQNLAPHVSVVVSPTVVQGDDAPPQIIEALEKLLRIKNIPETVILARGGGSFEDLFCFNDENLARYIAEYPLPVITGVGHETDFTIVDFVSDLRSPTPTAAAHDAVPDRDIVVEEVKLMASQWRDHLIEGIEGYSEMLQEIMARPVFTRPEHRWAIYSQEIDQLIERSMKAITFRIRNTKGEVEKILEIVDHTNPLKLLEKGYSLTYKMPEMKLITDVGKLAKGEHVRVKLWRGLFDAEVKSTEIDDEQEER